MPQQTSSSQPSRGEWVHRRWGSEGGEMDTALMYSWPREKWDPQHFNHPPSHPPAKTWTVRTWPWPVKKLVEGLCPCTLVCLHGLTWTNSDCLRMQDTWWRLTQMVLGKSKKGLLGNMVLIHYGMCRGCWCVTQVITGCVAAVCL